MALVQLRAVIDQIKAHPDDHALCRFHDLAATAQGKNPDPDWTASVLMVVTLGPDVPRGRYTVIDARRIRDTPHKVEQFLWDTHEYDDELTGLAVPIRAEQEGGSSGKIVADTWNRGRFAGIDFKMLRPKGSKAERFRPFSITCELGNVDIVQGTWNEDYLSELEMFDQGPHDDFVDASSGAFRVLAAQVREGTGAVPETIERTVGWGAL